MFSNALVHIFKFLKASQCFLSGRGALRANRQNRQSIKILKKTQKTETPRPASTQCTMVSGQWELWHQGLWNFASYFRQIQIFHKFEMSTLWKTALTISTNLIFGFRFFWFSNLGAPGVKRKKSYVRWKLSGARQSGDEVAWRSRQDMSKYQHFVIAAFNNVSL